MPCFVRSVERYLFTTLYKVLIYTCVTVSHKYINWYHYPGSTLGITAKVH